MNKHPHTFWRLRMLVHTSMFIVHTSTAKGGTMRVWSGLIVSLALVGFASGYPGQRGPGVAGAGTQARSEFIILGTASGPNSEANRAQPANALLVGGQPYLIDAGDGAVAQLAKANLRVGALRAVFLSHLHFDHTAGMLAVIGLRMQLETRGPLRIY